MPRFIGFAESTFDADLYRPDACKNNGFPLTTQGIMEGIEALVNDIKEHPEDNWLAAMKDTPMYVSPKKND